MKKPLRCASGAALTAAALCLAVPAAHGATETPAAPAARAAQLMLPALSLDWGHSSLGSSVFPGLGSPGTGTAGTAQVSQEAQIVAATNAFRLAHGTTPVAETAALDASAAGWARYLAATGQFHHQDLGVAQVNGENLYLGPEPSRAVPAWQNSAAHRAVMLGDYRHVGVGLAQRADGSWIVVQRFTVS